MSDAGVETDAAPHAGTANPNAPLLPEADAAAASAAEADAAAGASVLATSPNASDEPEPDSASCALRTSETNHATWLWLVGLAALWLRLRTRIGRQRR